MNPAKHVDWTSKQTHDALLRYFGLRFGEPSRYRMKYLFQADMTGDWNSIQMHESKIHADGSYVFVEGGKPAQKASFEARLDGIPSEFFDWPLSYVKQNEPDLYASAERVWNRGCFETYEQIAGQLCMSESGLRGRMDQFVKALVKVIGWFNWGSKWTEDEEIGA